MSYSARVFTINTVACTVDTVVVTIYVLLFTIDTLVTTRVTGKILHAHIFLNMLPESDELGRFFSSSILDLIGVSVH